MKSHLRRNWTQVQSADDPEFALYDACAEITGVLAIGWFRHSGYNIDI